MAKPPSFQVRAGPYSDEELAVTGFSGTEGLSRPFDFAVELFPKDDTPLNPAELLGKDILLSIGSGEDATRHVHGIIRQVEALGEHAGKLRYRVRLVPAIERLRHVRRSRIFQEQSVPKIVKKVLDNAKIEHRWATSASYAPREYCVQYRESDLDFISRLLEWEGIFYFFEHSETGHVLVLGDGTGACQDIPGCAPLPLREQDGRVPDEEHVRTLERIWRVRSGAVMVRDFDFQKPSLELSAKKAGAGEHAELEIYDYPAEYTPLSVGKTLSGIRLEERQQCRETQAGTSVCPRLCPGFTFEVDGSALGAFSGKLLAVEVQHFGKQPEVRHHAEPLRSQYHNEFRCLPKEVPFRPPRQTKRPIIPGVQTATVVGPASEEIHTDEHGRIKAQLHWDREGKRDDRCSCWIRVAQPWGGPAWGRLFLPRIGQEVVVRFLEGNPDRPLITGVVYNGQNVPPYELPAEKTKSTLKSSSSMGGNGFNELRIEDAAGEEEVYIHAQKDEDLITENDKAQEVRGFEDLLVKKDRTRTVEGNQRLDVSLDDMSVIGQNQTLRVTGNRTTKVAGSHDETVEGNQTVTVAKNRDVVVLQAASNLVGGAAALNIGAGYSANVALAMNEAVGGMKMEQVGGVRSEYVVGSRQESVTDNRAAQVGGNFQTEIKGQCALSVGKDLEEKVDKNLELGVTEPSALMAEAFKLKADKFSLIVNGKLILSLEKSGKVKLYANVLTIDGSKIPVKGGKVKELDAGSLPSKSVSLQDIDALSEPEPRSMEFNLKDLDGKPMKDMAYEMGLPDGTVKKGKTDGSGKVKADKMPARRPD